MLGQHPGFHVSLIYCPGELRSCVKLNVIPNINGILAVAFHGLEGDHFRWFSINHFCGYLTLPV